MTISPQAPTPDPYEEPSPDDDPETQPGDVPQGPQETNPDADDAPAVPLDSGRESDTEAESGL